MLNSHFQRFVSYEEYHPFGTTSYRSGKNSAEVSLKRYKYVGKERDEETGLYYYGARYYSAWLARFISVDPLQHKYPYYTPYQYAGNKPITYFDLDGLEEHKSNTLIDRTLAASNIKVGIEIVSKSEPPVDVGNGLERLYASSSTVRKTEVTIESIDEFTAEFYTQQTTFTINSEGEVISIIEQRRHWEVFETYDGEINAQGYSSPCIGKFKNETPIFFGPWQAEDAKEYVDKNEPIVAAWINLTKERSDLILRGRVPYHIDITINKAIDVAIDIIELYISTYGNSPIESNFPDVNQEENYFIPENEYDVAPQKIQEAKKESYSQSVKKMF